MKRKLQKGKRLLAFFLALCLIWTSCPLDAYATEPTSEESSEPASEESSEPASEESSEPASEESSEPASEESSEPTSEESSEPASEESSEPASEESSEPASEESSEPASEESSEPASEESSEPASEESSEPASEESSEAATETKKPPMMMSMRKIAPTFSMESVFTDNSAENFLIDEYSDEGKYMLSMEIEGTALLNPKLRIVIPKGIHLETYPNENDIVIGSYIVGSPSVEEDENGNTILSYAFVSASMNLAFSITLRPSYKLKDGVSYTTTAILSADESESIAAEQSIVVDNPTINANYVLIDTNTTASQTYSINKESYYDIDPLLYLKFARGKHYPYEAVRAVIPVPKKCTTGYGIGESFQAFANGQSITLYENGVEIGIVTYYDSWQTYDSSAAYDDPILVYELNANSAYVQGTVGSATSPSFMKLNDANMGNIQLRFMTSEVKADMTANTVTYTTNHRGVVTATIDGQEVQMYDGISKTVKYIFKYYNLGEDFYLLYQDSSADIYHKKYGLNSYVLPEEEDAYILTSFMNRTGAELQNVTVEYTYEKEMYANRMVGTFNETTTQLTIQYKTAKGGDTIYEMVLTAANPEFRLTDQTNAIVWSKIVIDKLASKSNTYQSVLSTDIVNRDRLDGKYKYYTKEIIYAEAPVDIAGEDGIITSADLAGKKRVSIRCELDYQVFPRGGISKTQLGKGDEFVIHFYPSTTKGYIDNLTCYFLMPKGYILSKYVQPKTYKGVSYTLEQMEMTVDTQMQENFGKDSSGIYYVPAGEYILYTIRYEQEDLPVAENSDHKFELHFIVGPEVGTSVAQAKVYLPARGFFEFDGYFDYASYDKKTDYLDVNQNGDTQEQLKWFNKTPSVSISQSKALTALGYITSSLEAGLGSSKNYYFDSTGEYECMIHNGLDTGESISAIKTIIPLPRTGDANGSTWDVLLTGAAVCKGSFLEQASISYSTDGGTTYTASVEDYTAVTHVKVVSAAGKTLASGEMSSIRLPMQASMGESVTANSYAYIGAEVTYTGSNGESLIKAQPCTMKPQVYAISGTIHEDTNGNGIMDETAQNSYMVYLHKGSYEKGTMKESTIASAATNNTTGKFSISKIYGAGDYTVQIRKITGEEFANRGDGWSFDGNKAYYSFTVSDSSIPTVINQRIVSPRVLSVTAPEYVYAEENGTIHANISPVLEEGEKITYTSSDSSVIKVSEDGTLEYVSDGKVTITVSVPQIESLKEVCGDTVTVTKEIYARKHQYAVILHTGEGTISDGSYTQEGNGVYKGTYTFQTAYTLPTPEAPSDRMYFVGWYTEPDGEGTRVSSISKGQYGDKEYYAKWGYYEVKYETSEGVWKGDTLRRALWSVCDGGTIVVLQDIVTDDYVVFDEEIDITIESDGTPHTITSWGIVLDYGTTLHLSDENLTLVSSGNEDLGDYGVFLFDGTLVLSGNPQIQTVGTDIYQMTEDGKFRIEGDLDDSAVFTVETAELEPASPFGDVEIADVNAHFKNINSDYLIGEASNGAFVWQKCVTITPDDNQKKWETETDPVFTYTISDPTISVTGALGRVAGEEAGSYAFTVATLSAGDGYALVLDANSPKFSIIPDVEAPRISTPVTKLDSETGKLMVTVPITDNFSGVDETLTTLKVNGKEVEYTLTKTESGWELVFERTTDAEYTLCILDKKGNIGTYRLDGSSDFYDLTFDMGKETAEEAAAAQEWMAGKVISLPEMTKTREGYVFKGWMYDGQIYASGSSFTVPTKDAAFVAKWAKYVRVTPDENQTKYLTEADPTYTYSVSETGLNLTGALGRVSGEEAGAYAFTLGTLSAGEDYILQLAENSPKFNIIADVEAPRISTPVTKLDSETGKLMVTVPITDNFSGVDETLTTLKVNGKEVEYTLTETESGWELVFERTTDAEYTLCILDKKGNIGTYRLDGSSDFYDLTFDMGKETAEEAAAAQEWMAGKVISLPEMTKTREGYAFKGWMYDGQIYASGSSFTVPTKDAAFVAKWAKYVRVTPDENQTKYLTEADPTFTYSVSETGLNLTGALGRVSGEEAGAYAFTLGTLSAGEDYILQLAENSPKFNIIADVEAPRISTPVSEIDSETGKLMVTVPITDNFSGVDETLTTLKVNGKEVEYTLTETESGWELVFERTTDAEYTLYILDKTGNIGTYTLEGSNDFYNLTFDMGKETAEEAAAGQEWMAGKVISLPEMTKTREGYAFKGWMYDGQIYASGSSFTVPTKDAAFVAKWAKYVRVTPDENQTKYLTEADPTYTYSVSETGLNLTGALGRVSGEEAGAYAFTLGTLSAGEDYILQLAENSPKFNIIADVEAPRISTAVTKLDSETGKLMVTVPITDNFSGVDETLTTLKVNGKEVEYTLTETESGWELVFERTTDAEYTLYILDKTGNIGTYTLEGSNDFYDLTFDMGKETAEEAAAGQEWMAGKVISLPTPNKTIEGYTFIGWEYESKLLTADSLFIVPAKDVAFTAKWAKIEICTDIHGTVHFENGLAAEGAKVQLYKAEKLVKECQVSADAMFTLLMISNGTYTLEVVVTDENQTEQKIVFDVIVLDDDIIIDQQSHTKVSVIIEKTQKIKDLEQAIEDILPGVTSSEIKEIWTGEEQPPKDELTDALNLKKDEIMDVSECYHDCTELEQKQMEEESKSKLDWILRIYGEISIEIKAETEKVAVPNHEELLSLVITEEDLQKREDESLDIKVTIRIDEVAENNAPDENVKEQMSQITANQSNRTIIDFYDITITKTVGNHSSSIRQIPREMDLVFEIPAGLQNGSDYVIVRNHDGVLSELETQREGNLLYAKSDLFSVYAIAYVPAEEPPITPPGNTSNDNHTSVKPPTIIYGSSEENPKLDEVPKTGEEPFFLPQNKNNILPWQEIRKEQTCKKKEEE